MARNPPPALLPVGLHHISVMTRAPQPNYAFFTHGLGLRLVKKTVNQDDPGVYHLYYGDFRGSPGTALTYFPWTHLVTGRPGWNEHARVGLRVAPGSLAFWESRLRDALGLAVERRDWFGTPELRFQAPDGSFLSILEGTGDHTAAEPWSEGPIPPEHAYRGFHYVEACLRQPDRTARLFEEVLGFGRDGGEGDAVRFRLGAASDQWFVLRAAGDAPQARPGSGTIHHVAFRVPDDATHEAVRLRLLSAGFEVTPVIDRYYFKAIYFRDANGLLFEIATDPPGFAVDEPLDRLGETLALPPFLESRREQIEGVLPPLEA